MTREDYFYILLHDHEEEEDCVMIPLNGKIKTVSMIGITYMPKHYVHDTFADGTLSIEKGIPTSPLLHRCLKYIFGEINE